MGMLQSDTHTEPYHQRAELRLPDLALALMQQLVLQRRDVALQVAFERQTLKPVFSLYRL
jgi:hypothetical protein